MLDEIQDFRISLDKDLDPFNRRKIEDVLTNLGLRIGSRFVQAVTSDHYLTYKDTRWIWSISGKDQSVLSEGVQEAVDIFSFKHLQVDPAFPLRPTMTKYDSRTLFLEEIFKKLGTALNMPLQKPDPATPVSIIVQITHDVDNPQLLTAYQIMRACALVLWGNVAQIPVLKAVAKAWFQCIFRRKSRNLVDPFWCFSKIHALGEDYGFRSTFFTHAQYNGKHRLDPRYRVSNERYQSILTDLTNKGHEVGLHSGIKFNDFLKTREKLPTDPVRSHRAHYWAAPLSELENWYDTMARAGITGDASISPQKTGYGMGNLYPLYLTTQSERHVVLYASQFMDAYHMREQAEDVILDGINNYTVSTLTPVINLNWHVRTFSGIGPWAGYDKAFNKLLDTVIERFDVTFQTMEQSTAQFEKVVYEFQFKT